MRYVESCVDYRTYMAQINPKISSMQFTSLKNRLQGLGVTEPERMGVVYVHGPWGFVVIPRPGFSDLRISFYHEVSEQERNAVLESIESALYESHATVLQTGGKDE